MTNNDIKINCLEVNQPIGTFYIGVLKAKDLIDISYSEIRKQEGREIERYIGTQRDLSENRVNEIKRYVNTVDACFPTSIILAIKSDDINYDKNNGTIYVKKGEKVAKIIDGQHRIAGLIDYSGPNFELNVTIFIDMDIEDQALIFATINLKQTKVSKSLAYDLYEFAKSRSPQKTCHNIAKLLNFKDKSPFYHRIKILGKASGEETEVITQAAFVDRLLKLISLDPMKDRDSIKRNIPLEKNNSNNLIFRDKFEKGKDAEIAKILWNYFKAVEQKWPESWNDFKQGKILSKTTGFAAFMRFLPFIYSNIDKYEEIPSQEKFFKIINKSTLIDNEFTIDKFKPGSSGESALYNRLISDLL
jgi:DGQHR domain-containing protein